MMLEGTFCWEDSETGCLCGNDCEPPEWMRTAWNAQEPKAGKWPHTEAEWNEYASEFRTSRHPTCQAHFANISTLCNIHC